MDLTATLSEIKNLTVDDRLLLVEAIWESIVQEPGQLQLTEAQREELDRRLAAHIARPDEAIGWDEVKAEALERARR